MEKLGWPFRLTVAETCYKGVKIIEGFFRRVGTILPPDYLTVLSVRDVRLSMQH